MIGISLPIYGFGGLVLFVIWSINITKIIWLDVILLSLISTIILTSIEFIGGFISFKYYNNRLWDYTDFKYNYKGFICPLFSFLWFIFSMIFGLFIMPWLPNLLFVLETDIWLTFVLGFGYGLFIIDLIYSLDLLSKIRSYAKELNQIMNFQIIKEEAYSNNITSKKYQKLKPYVKKHINNELLSIKSKKSN